MVLNLVKINNYNIDDTPSISEVGGKTYNTIIQFTNGINIPDSLYLSVDSFEKLLLSPNINLLFSSLLEKFINQDEFDISIRDNLCYAIKSSSKKWKLDTDLKLVNSIGIMVRSSCSLEDGNNFSFAGLFESIYVDITGDYINAIADVYCSVFSEKVFEYCKRNKLEIGHLKMGVLLQQIINPDVSGVAFTASPNDAHLYAIEVVNGLGESLVSGITIPTNYIVDPLCSQIKLEELGIQDEKLIINHNSQVEGVINAKPPELDLNQIQEVVSVGEKLNKIYKNPQDFEFCFKDNIFILLQSRSITT